MKLAALVLAMFASMNASAVYVNANPPNGWSSPTVNSESKHLWKAPANSTYVTPIRNPAGKLVFPAQTTISVAGKLTTFPIAFPQAANAAKFIARSVFSMSTLTPLAIAALAQWLISEDLLPFTDPADGQLKWGKRPATETFGNTQEYGDANNTENKWYPNKELACQHIADKYHNANGGFGIKEIIVNVNSISPMCQIYYWGNAAKTWFTGGNRNGASRGRVCPSNWTYINGQCVNPDTLQPVPVTPEQFEQDVEPLEIPETLPEKLPFPIPVDDPVQNPVPFPLGPPTPWTVPTGDPSPAPQPRPNPDPYPWQQPGVQTTPSPKPNEPLRTDQKPVNTPLPTNQGNDSPNPAPVPTPATQPSGGGAPAPEEKKGELCDYFPKILACAEMTAPSEVPVPNKDVPVAITPTEGIGASNGMCPPDKQVHLGLVGTITVSYDLVCRYVEGLRPVVIALAWLTAAMIFVGAIKRD